jgi:hypothetical protein
MGANSASDVGIQPLQYANISNTLSQLPTQIGNLASSQSAVNPTVQTQLNTPTAQQAMSGAQTAASYGPDVASDMWNVGQNAIQAGQSITPYAQQVFQTSMDPQGQLYNWLQNQNMQQTNAQNAASGVGTTPYGAAVADQSNMLFNINWQNQQLQRQIQGLQAGAGALQTGAGIEQSGTSLESQIPSFISGTSAIPYSTQSTISGTNLSDLATGTNISNIPITDLLALLTGQNQTNQVANDTSRVGLAQSQIGTQQLAGLIGGGSSLLGGLLGGTGTGIGSLGSGLNGLLPLLLA